MQRHTGHFLKCLIGHIALSLSGLKSGQPGIIECVEIPIDNFADLSIIITAVGSDAPLESRTKKGIK